MECSNYNLSLECTSRNFKWNDYNDEGLGIFNVETISECNINIETVERTDYINLNVLPLYIYQLPKEKLLLLTTAILANYLIMHKKHFKNCSDRSSEIFRKYAVKEFINIKPTLKRLFDWCSSSETKFCHENVSEFHSKSVFNFPSIFNCFGIFKYNSQKFVGNHSVTCSGSQQRKLKYSHSREKIWYNHLCSKMSGKNQSNQCQKMNIHLEKENENLLYVVERSNSKYLLGPVKIEDKSKKCCVIDLDETLVHSSFKELMKYDFKISVEIDGDMHEIYILKRPYVDLFLTKMRSLFECVLFTASLAKYANPVADLLDKSDVFRYRLFRESCIFMKGGFVKDLSMLGRTLDQIVIIDNSPVSFMLHPQNAIQITSWFDDLKDRALLDLIPYLQKLAQSTSVTNYLKTDTPPITAAFPTSMAPRLSNKTFYSNMYAPNIPNQIVRNNPITNISQIEQLTFKKTSSSSTGSLKKSVMHGFPSLRNLFSKTFTGNSTEKTNYAGPDIVSKYVVTANIRNNKDFPLNIDRELSIRNAQKEKNFENPSSSSLTFSPVIKQNLNSASEIFSPRYYQVKYSKLIASEETGKYSSLNKNRFRHFLKINNKKRKKY